MKIIAVIQARMESTRLPGKVLKPVAGEPMLKRIVERVSQSRCLDSVIVATSCNSADNAIEEFCRQEGILCFRGSQDNVLERYYQCSSQYQGEIIIRLTADNVFVDPDIIMDAVQCFQINGQIDYLYYREGLPLGMAVEVFTMEALRKAYQEAGDAECKEHVTLYMYRNPRSFHCVREKGSEDYSFLRLTMDTAKDYQMIEELYTCLLHKGMAVSYGNVVKELLHNEKLRSINEGIVQKIPVYGLGDKGALL